ncbi:MAG TPA: addiction module toxin RelE [Planctomycetota bacterium]|nr:addiction module toxin RelE [Planctomycetota bacterium]
MANTLKFNIKYDSMFEEHLSFVDSKYHSLIRSKIVEQLQFEPNVETKNRKLLRPQTVLAAKWEIRFGPANRFRVFYSFDEAIREVYVSAFGEKERERLYIGGEEIIL